MTKISNLYSLTNYITANSSGSISIAAPTSGYALEVLGTGRYSGALSGSSATFTGALVGTSATFSGDTTLKGDTRVLYFQNAASNGYPAYINATNNTSLIISANQNIPLDLRTNDATRIYITNGGYVGMGTTSPSSRLQVEIAAESPATGQIALIAKTSNGINDIFRWYDGTTQLGVFKNSGFVGIGTSSPTVRLEARNDSTTAYDAATGTTNRILNIRNATSGTGYNAFINFITEPNGEWYLGAVSKANYSDLVFMSRDASYGERMRITSSGNVGIGTTSPQVLLQVGEGSLSNNTTNQYLRVNAGVYNAASTSNLDLFNFGNNFGNALGWRLTSGTEGVGVSVGRYLSFNTVVTDGSGNPSTATERMRITSGGNLLVGTTSTANFGANRTTVQINGTDGSGYAASYNGTLASYIFSSSAGTDIVETRNAYMAFSTNGSERMRITSDGLLQFSTTNAAVLPTTNNIIHSYGTNGFMYIQGGSTGLALAGSGNRNNAIYVNTTSNIITFVTNNAERLRITNGGVLDFAGNSTETSASDRFSMGFSIGNYAWIQSWGGNSLYLNKQGNAVYAGTARIDNNSDARVKDNIQPITGALSKVLSMNGKKFHMLDEPEDKIRLGFIAQELQGVVDELVIESNRTQTLPSGEVVENVLGLETWGSSWAALLVEAIKELSAQNIALEARLAALENA